MAQLGWQGGEDILRQILRLGGTPGQPPSQPLHAVIMALDQHAKGRAVARSGGSCKGFIGRIHQHDNALTHEPVQSLGR